MSFRSEHYGIGVVGLLVIAALSAEWIFGTPQKLAMHPYPTPINPSTDYLARRPHCGPGTAKRPGGANDGVAPACEAEMENRRIQQAQLEQQARAADIVEQNLRLSYRQAWSVFGQAAATILAFGAAVMAALYARGAVKEGRNSATAAQETLEHAQITSKQQLRAYVGFDGAEARYLDGSRPVEIMLKFKNAGQTPAYKFSTKGGCTLFPYPGPTKFKDVSDHIHAPLTVPPGGATIKMEYADLPSARLANLKAGKDVLYVFGTITYEDIFGQPHYVNYRWLIGGKQKISMTEKDGKLVELLAPAEDGNDSD